MRIYFLSLLFIPLFSVSCVATQNDSFSLKFNNQAQGQSFTENQFISSADKDESWSEEITESGIKNVPPKEIAKRMMLAKKEIFVTAQDKTFIPTKFFNRNSNKLVVLGCGCNYSKEYFWHQVYREFKDYDVVTFDYRVRNFSTLKNLRFKRSFFYYLFHPGQLLIDNLVEIPISDVITIAEHFKRRKKYEEVIGFGLCYSALTLLGAQCESEKNNKPLFSKLILESLWVSPRALFKDFLRILFCRNFSHAFFSPMAALRFLLPLFIPKTSFENNLENLQCPNVLFIHHKRDKLFPLHRIWGEMKHNTKTALTTPFDHAQGIFSLGLKKSHVCKYVLTEFIKAPTTQEFQEKMKAKIRIV